MSRSVDWSLLSQTDARQISHIDLHQRLDACLNRLPDGSGKSDGLGGSGDRADRVSKNYRLGRTL